MILPLLGVSLPQFSADPGPSFAAAEEAHRLGYAGGFVFDHLWPLGARRDAPVLEGWTLLAALAARVGGLGAGASGLRLGTLVTRAGLRPPALVARMAGTVGSMAGTRPVIALGTGDRASRNENVAYGLGYGRVAFRVRQLTATVEALRELGPAGPEVWVGGRDARVRRLAGRVADAWNAWALDPTEVTSRQAEVLEAARRAGRAGQVGVTWAGQVLVARSRSAAHHRRDGWAKGRPRDDVDRTLAGSPDDVLARFEALAEVGCAWCVPSFVGPEAPTGRRLLAQAAGLPARP